VEEPLAPGAKVKAVARRDRVAASLVFTWRRQVRTSEQVAPSFVPVQIATTEAEETPKLSPAGNSRGRSVAAARIEMKARLSKIWCTLTAILSVRRSPEGCGDHIKQLNISPDSQNIVTGIPCSPV